MILLIVYLVAGAVITAAAASDNAAQRAVTRAALTYHRGPTYALLVEASAAAVMTLLWPIQLPAITRALASQIHVAVLGLEPTHTQEDHRG